jgi:site-specific DNA-methyltransferase (adenine-specific)
MTAAMPATAPIARMMPIDKVRIGDRHRRDLGGLAPTSIVLNTPQRRDAHELCSLPNACSTLVFLDPQFRGVLNFLDYGNEGSRQRGRAELPAMTDTYIDMLCCEVARVLKPRGYLMRWTDTFHLCQADHLRVADLLSCVDLIAWDNLRLGNGYRSRRRGDYLLILQKSPVTARTWKDHGIPNRWVEKVDRKIHPHITPIGLITRLIAAVTEPGDLVVDPAAGSFTDMRAAQQHGLRPNRAGSGTRAMRILGVDPGIRGGLAVVEINNGAARQLVDAIDIPVTGVGAKERVDVLALHTWITAHRPQYSRCLQLDAALMGMGGIRVQTHGA